MCKALLIDHQPMTRLAMQVLLEQKEMDVVGAAETGVSGLALARDTQPDLILLDITLPKLDGLELLSRLRHAVSDCKLLVLTSLPASLYASRCRSAGANGFLSKQDDLDDIKAAIKSVMAGYSLFPSEVQIPSGRAEKTGEEVGLLSLLSDRELTVLQNLANGRNNKEIAEQLFISHKTVSTYKSRLMEKLHTRRMVDLIDLARRNELCS
ncbi:Virulence factors putative positive transcription regulator BvgA [compost metagenome]